MKNSEDAVRSVHALVRLLHNDRTLLNVPSSAESIAGVWAATMMLAMSQRSSRAIEDVSANLIERSCIEHSEAVTLLPHFGDGRYARYALFPFHPNQMVIPCATSNALAEFDVYFNKPMLAVPLTANTTVDDLPPQHTHGFLYTVDRECMQRDFALSVSFDEARKALYRISTKLISRSAIDFIHMLHATFDSDVRFTGAHVVFPVTSEFRSRLKSGRMFPVRYLPLLGRFEDHLGPILERLHSHQIQDMDCLNKYDFPHTIALADSYADIYRERADDLSPLSTARVSLIHKHVVARGHSINAFYNPVGELAFFAITMPDGKVSQVSGKMYVSEVHVLTSVGLRGLNPVEESDRVAEPLAIVLFERGEFTVLTLPVEKRTSL